MQSLVQKQVLSRRSTARSQRGFTLVELLVVIAIIGILMGIAVPAIFGVIGTAKSNKQRLEIGAIEQAIERYSEKYGDYPPDFSDWTIVERHYRKIFPRIAADELNLLSGLLEVANNNWTVPDKMDRAEAIVWVLGGYSSNPINPFTGDGGPLEFVGINPDNNTRQFQINVDRDNAFYEFDTMRLDLQIPDKNEPITTSNFYRSSDLDLFPHYAAHDDGTPFVYFDQRTYAAFNTVGGINRYVNSTVTDGTDCCRPYLSEFTNEEGLAFCNPDTFQVIGPGLDGRFGFASNEDGPADLSAVSLRNALYYVYPTGRGWKYFVPPRGVASWEPLDISRYQEPARFDLVDNPHQDNLTNFADGKLIDELQE
ncbi:type II secretion system GspH family protein [Rubripirellula sp.]|nr:type II secretion system GspH family protein [Rubripirellula sp.]